MRSRRELQASECISAIWQTQPPRTFAAFRQNHSPRIAAMCRQLSLFGTEVLDREPDPDFLAKLYATPTVQH